MATKSLSKASPFETTFKTRYRGPGRPSGDDTFAGDPEAHPLLKQQAQRRAFAVVHEENKERLGSLYDQEMAVLRRRGVEQVAEDCGIDLEAREERQARIRAEREAKRAESEGAGQNG